MKVETYDGRVDRQILAGMVMDKAVLGAVASRWDKSHPPFASREMNLLGAMAVQHYMKYKKAPGRDIVGHFDRWAQDGAADPDTVRLTERILSSVSQEYEQGTPLSSAYLLDLADQRFNAVRAKELRDLIDADLSSGDVQKAMDRIDLFRPLRIGAASGVSLLSEPALVKSAFESQGEVVMRWGQKALDDFFEDSLERDAFVTFVGKEKVGKSFWLQEVMWSLIHQGRNTAFFEVGDQSQAQVIRRIAARAAGRPYKADRLVRVPTALDTSSEPAEVDYEERSYDAPMTWDEVSAAFRNLSREVGKDRLKLSVHPNSSISALGIEAIVESWVRSGWVPDAIVLDYIDILAPIDGKADTRDQINATWKALRRLNQQYHCLLVGATQADAASYDAKMLTMRNFSEDKRKHSHVTGMVGINQTTKEKEKGIYRLNWIVGRDLEFSTDRCVYTAACLPLANPAVISSF